MTGTAATAFSYDPVGRASALDECLPSGCGTSTDNRQLQYTYDWAGDLLTSTDGASTGGVLSTYTYSPASEVLSLTSSLSDTTDPANLVSNVQNGPSGPTSCNLGNGLSSVYHYDALGRLNGGWVCSGSTSAFCNGGTPVYGFTNKWKQQQLTCSSDTALNQGTNYSYDEFSRLTSSTVNSGAPVNNFSWVYDRWGNRWQQNVTAGSGPQPQLSFNTGSNQVTNSGFAYDAAGNMTNNTVHTYTYDAEGNITAVDGGATASYVYNALNQRVRTVTGSAATEYVFNANGQRVSEWDGTARVQLKGKYYWGAKPVAFYTTAASGSAGAHFEHQDWMGTERLRTTYNGGVEGTFTSLPWGDGPPSGTGSDLDANHYATLDHDTETGTDHAQFRQYSNTQGRWLSPDPYGGSYDASNPQSFNRYVYAMNSPLSYVDPSGLDWQYDSGTGCWHSSSVSYEDGSYQAIEEEYCGGGGYYGPTGWPYSDGTSYTAGANDNGGGSSSSNLLQTLKKIELCNLQAELAEAKKGAIPLALDAAGFVPGESQTVAAVQTLVGFGSIVNSMAQGDWTGAGIGATGTVTTVAGLAATGMGVSWAKAIPVVGYGVNAVGTAYDLYGTISTGFQAYKTCMSQP